MDHDWEMSFLQVKEALSHFLAASNPQVQYTPLQHKIRSPFLVQEPFETTTTTTTTRIHLKKPNMSSEILKQYDHMCKVVVIGGGHAGALFVVND